MGFVGALRTLWRFRLAVIAIAVLAVMVGIAVGYRFSPPSTLSSRQYQVAVASATALLDTPSSQVVDLGGGDASAVNGASLVSRASLLASVMTSSPIKDEIAARAGLPPDKLVAISPAVADPVPGAASAATKIKDPDAHVLRATVPSLDSGQVPMITVQTQAPEPATATRLANAAIEVIQKHLETVATTDKVPIERRLVVRQLGPARAELQTRGPGKTIAVVAVIVCFGLGCGAILLLVALVGGWRVARELERMPVGQEFPINGHDPNRHEPVFPQMSPAPAKLDSDGVTEPRHLEVLSADDSVAEETRRQRRNWASH